MNRATADACVEDVEEFKRVVAREKTIVNDLAYQGFVESLNRVEKDGPFARFDSEPYFGKDWKTAVDSVDIAYTALKDAIQAKGFGLGGLVYDFLSGQTAASLGNSQRLED